MIEDRLTLDTSDGPMPAYLACPNGTARGGILIGQDSFGVTGQLEGVCREFAEAGWTALAPSFFHRDGSPVVPFSEVPSFSKRITLAGLMTDLDASFACLRNQGFDDRTLGTVGFCMGGSVAIVAGALFPIAASVTWYATGIVTPRMKIPPLVDLAPELKCPWLGIFNDKAPEARHEEVELLRAAAGRSREFSDIVLYPDADHGFHNRERPEKFNEAASLDAWGRTLDFLAVHIQSKMDDA